MVPDDDLCDPLAQEDPAGAPTPPTPPVMPSPSPSPAPLRQRAMAHLRSVSIPDLVSNMAGKDPARKFADFDRHYMPDGQPSPDASARGNADDHDEQVRVPRLLQYLLATLVCYILYVLCSLCILHML